MHTRRFNRAEGFDGAGQFAFQRTLVVHLLAELADAEFFLVQQFKAYRSAFWQPLLGEAQTQVIDFIGGDFNRTAIIREAIRHVHLSQLRDDGTTVLIRQIAIKHLIIRRFCPEYEGHNNGDSRGTRNHQWDFRICTNAGQPLLGFVLWRLCQASCGH
ncbi:hypothetical protein D3C75_722710 [compost metagenome]